MQPHRRLCSLAAPVVLYAILIPAAAGIARGEGTAEQKAHLRETAALIREAGAAFQAGQYPEAGHSLSQAMLKLELALRDADRGFFDAASPAIIRIERAHALLQLEGVVLPPFERPQYGVQRPSYLDAEKTAAIERPAAAGMEPANLSPPGPRSPMPQPKDAMAGLPTAGPPTVMAASESKPVSFARQIAPLLVGNCNGCHLGAMQIRGGLRMDSFAQLLRGGDSGPAVEPGNGDGSLLVRKLRGMEGARMPAGGRPAFSEEDIALVRTWIDEGAKLDGASPDQDLRVMMTEAWAKNATHEELAQRRRELARKNWRLAAPEEARGAVVEVENDEVLVLGNVSTETAERVAKAATAALKKVRTVIPPAPRAKGDSAASPFKGRITLFVFPKRYDYSEFSKMVEQRQLPAEWTAHWQYDGVDAYASLVVDQDDLKALQGRLLAPLASLSLAARGELPRWLVEGTGRATAARFAARDFDGPKQWDAALPAAVGVVEKPEQLTEGQLPPEQADLVGYGIGKTLLDRGARRQFDGLIRNLDGGAPFEEAFVAAFGASPKEFVTTWLTWYATNQRR